MLASKRTYEVCTGVPSGTLARTKLSNFYGVAKSCMGQLLLQAKPHKNDGAVAGNLGNLLSFGGAYACATFFNVAQVGRGHANVLGKFFL
ncbi:MAG: hypothetical protein R3C68_16245 [Myxococcota bacterium]